MMTNGHRVDPTQASAEEQAGRYISIALVVAGAFALLGIVTENSVATALSVVAVGIVTAIPILRVAWLVKRWAGQRDTKFAWVAVLLLVLIAIGPLVGYLQR